MKKLSKLVDKWADCNKKIRFIETILHLRMINLLEYQKTINTLIWDYQTYFGQLRVCGFKVEEAADLFHLRMVRNTEQEIRNLKIIKEGLDKAIKNIKIEKKS